MMVVGRGLSRLSVGVMALATVALLGGCSVPDAVNPVAWYRDLSGASKNDALDQDQRNDQNLEAGGKQPYPNLGDVPNAPDQALSQAKRDALQKSLVADRENASYSDEKLRAGVITPGAIAPAPPAPVAIDPAPPAPVAVAPPASAPAGPAAAPQPKVAAAAEPAPAPAAPDAAAASAPPAAPAKAAAPAPKQQTAALPQESAIAPPSIAKVPEGETPAPPPPPPNLPRSSAAAASQAPSTAMASLASGKRRPEPASSVAVASITFSAGSDVLSDVERNRVSEIAALQHKEGGEIRVIGHAEASKGGTVAQQELASLSLALHRAKAVAQALSSEGVASQSIDIEAAPTRVGESGGAIAEIYLEH